MSVSWWNSPLSTILSRSLKAALANSIAIVAAYVAVAVLVWSIADATMPATCDLDGFAAPMGGEQARDEQIWRVAHLSDIHVVGEQYGFRLESGRSGPRGNGRLIKVLKRLDDLQADEPLHAILVTGDITDAGLATEWAEFFEAVSQFPRVAQRMFLIPGNHDINVVNRANPAQFDLPTSPNKKLRKLRVLSALNAIQGSRVRVLDRRSKRLDETLERALNPYVAGMVKYAETARPRGYLELDDLWSNAFPMVLPPEHHDGLGIILLNSNADTHFSFTNALGMVSADQFSAVDDVIAQYPRACWIICIHHHVIEYPRADVALSERIGTALINGLWFVRRLQPFADKIVVMHGHRHHDWFGRCGAFPILSAPSAVMGGNGRCADPLLHPHDRGRSRCQDKVAATAACRRNCVTRLLRPPPARAANPRTQIPRARPPRPPSRQSAAFSIGPAATKVWNSPFSPQGSADAGSSASKAWSSRRPANSIGSCLRSTHAR